MTERQEDKTADKVLWTLPTGLLDSLLNRSYLTSRRTESRGFDFSRQSGRCDLMRFPLIETRLFELLYHAILDLDIILIGSRPSPLRAKHRSVDVLHVFFPRGCTRSLSQEEPAFCVKLDEHRAMRSRWWRAAERLTSFVTSAEKPPQRQAIISVTTIFCEVLKTLRLTPRPVTASCAKLRSGITTTIPVDSCDREIRDFDTSLLAASATFLSDTLQGEGMDHVEHRSTHWLRPLVEDQWKTFDAQWISSKDVEGPFVSQSKETATSLFCERKPSSPSTPIDRRPPHDAASQLLVKLMSWFTTLALTWVRVMPDD